MILNLLELCENQVKEDIEKGKFTIDPSDTESLRKLDMARNKLKDGQDARPDEIKLNIENIIEHIMSFNLIEKTYEEINKIRQYGYFYLYLYLKINIYIQNEQRNLRDNQIREHLPELRLFELILIFILVILFNGTISINCNNGIDRTGMSTALFHTVAENFDSITFKIIDHYLYNEHRKDGDSHNFSFDASQYNKISSQFTSMSNYKEQLKGKYLYYNIIDCLYLPSLSRESLDGVQDPENMSEIYMEEMTKGLMFYRSFIKHLFNGSLKISGYATGIIGLRCGKRYNSKKDKYYHSHNPLLDILLSKYYDFKKYFKETYDSIMRDPNDKFKLLLDMSCMFNEIEMPVAQTDTTLSLSERFSFNSKEKDGKEPQRFKKK